MEDMEYPVASQLSSDKDEALRSPCIGIDKKGEVLMVGFGLEYPGLLGFTGCYHGSTSSHYSASAVCLSSRQQGLTTFAASLSIFHEPVIPPRHGSATAHLGYSPLRPYARIRGRTRNVVDLLLCIVIP